MTKIAFVSPHCVVDFTNGAATATLDALAFLQSLGFQCEAFCNTRLDAAEEVLVEEILAQRGMRYQVRNAEIGRYRGRMIFTAYGSYAMQDALTPGGRGEDEAKSEVGSQMSEELLSPPRAPSSPLPAPRSVPVTLFNSASTRGAWINREEIAAFLTACSLFLKKNRPDLVWTYGGDPAALAVQGMAKQLGIPVLFALHNLSCGSCRTRPTRGGSSRRRSFCSCPRSWRTRPWWRSKRCSTGFRCWRAARRPAGDDWRQPSP